MSLRSRSPSDMNSLSYTVFHVTSKQTLKIVLFTGLLLRMEILYVRLEFAFLLIDIDNRKPEIRIYLGLQVAYCNSDMHC
jgi:hypothetical protein